MACTRQDAKQQAKNIMAPAYSMHPNTGYIVDWMQTTGYIPFLQSMWAGYLNGGCMWWTNRINHFSALLNSGVNPNTGNAYGAYQLQVLSAKLVYVQTMYGICGCIVIGPTLPVAPPTGQEGTSSFINPDEDLSGSDD